MLVVTTSKYILCIDLLSDSIRVLEAYGGIYYGLAYQASTRTIYVATRNSTTGPAHESSRQSERGSILCIDETLQIREYLESPFALRDIHGICLSGDCLYVTCSFDNMIAQCSLASREWCKWYPHPHPQNRDQDINHLNSIAHFEGRFYVVAHNWGKSQVFVFNEQFELLEVIELGFQAHDFFFDGEGRASTLSSLEGKVRSSGGVLARTGGFPRGVCRVEGGYAIGVSTRATASDRVNETGLVQIYSPIWEHKRDIVLPNVGMINQMCLVPKAINAFETLQHLPIRSINPRQHELDASFYDCGLKGIDADRGGGTWHRPEPDGCWTAAKSSSLILYLTPRHIAFDIACSGFDGINLSICFEGIVLISHTIENGRLSIGVSLPTRSFSGDYKLTFSVDRLTQPMNGDVRKLGVFVHHVHAIYRPDTLE